MLKLVCRKTSLNTGEDTIRCGVSSADRLTWPSPLETKKLAAVPASTLHGCPEGVALPHPPGATVRLKRLLTSAGPPGMFQDSSWPRMDVGMHAGMTSQLRAIGEISCSHVDTANPVMAGAACESITTTVESVLVVTPVSSGA